MVISLTILFGSILFNNLSRESKVGISDDKTNQLVKLIAPTKIVNIQRVFYFIMK